MPTGVNWSLSAVHAAGAVSATLAFATASASRHATLRFMSESALSTLPLRAAR